MPEMKPFRVIVAVPYEIIVYGETADDVLESVREGDANQLNEFLENGVPMVETLAEVFNDDTTMVEPATAEDQERILGEADPDIENALTDEQDPGPLDENEDEDEEEEEDGG